MIGCWTPVAMAVILMQMCGCHHVLSSWGILQCPITMAMGSRGHGDSVMCKTPGRPVAMAKKPSVRAISPICGYAITPEQHKGAGLILSWVSLISVSGVGPWEESEREGRGYKMADWALRSAKRNFGWIWLSHQKPTRGIFRQSILTHLHHIHQAD